MKTASVDQSGAVPGSQPPPQQRTGQSVHRSTDSGGRRQVSRMAEGGAGGGSHVRPERPSSTQGSGCSWVSGYGLVARIGGKSGMPRLSRLRPRACLPPLPFRSPQPRQWPPRRPSCPGVMCASAGHDGTCSQGAGRGGAGAPGGAKRAGRSFPRPCEVRRVTPHSNPGSRDLL